MIYYVMKMLNMFVILISLNLLKKTTQADIMIHMKIMKNFAKQIKLIVKVLN